MRDTVIGWDIGGAHIKAAALDEEGTVTRVLQHECALWRGLEPLRQSIKKVMADLDVRNCRHAVTMTGELVDFFKNRREGVGAILQVVDDELGAENLYVFAGRFGLVSAEDLCDDQYNDVASANWLASGLWLAELIDSGVFIDVGTTTTDLLLIDHHQLKARGFTDYDRMRFDELVYTGVVRTPVMAIANRVPFEGSSVRLAAEVFATTADVYRLTGDLLECADQHPAADGGGKSLPESARRLARMIGRDLDSDELSSWSRLACYFREQQISTIQSAFQIQASRSQSEECCLIGAGVGRFLVKQLADRISAKYVDFGTLLNEPELRDCFGAADCAPVVSIAKLLRQSLN